MFIIGIFRHGFETVNPWRTSIVTAVSVALALYLIININIVRWVARALRNRNPKD